MCLLNNLRPLCRIVPHLVRPSIAHTSATVVLSPLHTGSGPLCANNKLLNLKRRTVKDAFFRRRDQIPEDYQVIYKAPMEGTVAACKHFATFSLSFTGAAILYKYAMNMDIVDVKNLVFHVGPTVSEGAEMLGFGVAFFAFNIAMLVACAKYPLRIYKNKTNYIAMFEGYLPLSARPYHFTAGQVKETFNGITPWHESMYRMNKRSVLLLTQYFRTPSELIQMMEAPSKTVEKVTKTTQTQYK